MVFDRYRVYHYRPDKKPRDLDTLVAKKLFSAKLETLNDPFEFSALNSLSEYPEKQAEFSDVGVTCFCRSITNPLLWSHYASSHRGFAIGFDSAHPFFGGDKGVHGRFLLDVRYDDVAPSLDWLSADELKMVASTTKPTCWAYEQEVRMIKQVGGQTFDVPQDAMKEVVFGAKMPSERIEEIIESINNAKITVKFAEMRFLKEGYGVRPAWM